MVYGQSSTTYLKSDASTGRHYIDLNAAAESYRGAWLYGNEHIIMNIGRLRAEWEQFCPVPADIRDGILMRGSVLYRNRSGHWVRSRDQFEGVLRTRHGRHGGRYFVGKTQHTFTGRGVPRGHLTVVAKLNINLSHKAASNPLVSVPRQRPVQQAPIYQRNAYTPPTLSYPEYHSPERF